MVLCMYYEIQTHTYFRSSTKEIATATILFAQSLLRRRQAAILSSPKRARAFSSHSRSLKKWASLNFHGLLIKMTHINYIIIFTTRKRSLGQGYVFTRVCHSVYRRGVSVWGVSVRETPPRQRPSPVWRRSGGTHPTGMLSCLHYFLTFFV